MKYRNILSMLFGKLWKKKEVTFHGNFYGQAILSLPPIDHRNMILQSNVEYVDPNGVKWVAKKGRIINGSSIPRHLWSVLGYSPYVGAHRWAAIFHDTAVEDAKLPWQQVHRMYYDACIAKGVKVKTAKAMYTAVYHFGPRWGSVRLRELATPEQEKQRLKDMLSKIDGLTLEGIEGL